MKNWIFATTLTLLLPCAGRAQTEVRKPAEPKRDYAPLFKGLGKYHFAISTKSKTAQRYFDQGMVLAFGFNHAEAARSFRGAQKHDPSCAMAYWGEALVLGPNINAAMEDADVPKAWAALQKARKHASRATRREQDYIKALATRYVAEPVEDRSKLDEAYAEAMRQLVAKYPHDHDAQCLFAEALMDTSPWNYWDGDQPKRMTKELLRVLERVLARRPNHPLANHLYIHAVEAAHPEWAEACADRLRDLVPGAGHLVHMPSHIYIRVGRYADARIANEKAVSVDADYVTQCHAQGVYPLAYMPHNRHFLWFAASMEGRSRQSIEAARHISKHADPKLMRKPGLGVLQHFLAMEMYALARFGKWKELLRYRKPAKDLKYPIGIWHFVRGLANLRSGEVNEAEKHLGALNELGADESLKKILVFDNNNVQILLRIAGEVLAGEIAAVRDDFRSAEKHLRQAVRLEDSMRYDEPQLWYIPTRQTLGMILLEAERPKEAEATFRSDLAKYPENGWSLFGLMRALRAQGKTKEAAAVKERFDRAWKNADVKLSRAGF